MPARKNNLLIVEDDSQLRILFSTILAQSGYRVRAAEDGFAALVEIRAGIPDVILSDLYMLGMSGFELLSIVRRRFPVIKVIAMSSSFSGGEIPPGVAADAFYQKATGIVSLLQIVQDAAAPRNSRLSQRDADSAPIWIATQPPNSGPDANIEIACPECLRTSSFAPDSSVVVVRKIECAHCHTHIHYALVQNTDPGPPMELWRTPPQQPSATSAAA
jgi:CheY-like chemotaxis protein